MIELVTDPSKKIRYYFRVNSTPLPKTITVTDAPYDFTTKVWVVNFKRNAGDTTNVLSLTDGLGITITSNSISIQPTQAQVNIQAREYFIEVRNVTDGHSLFTGVAIGHNGEFDNFDTDSDTIFLTNTTLTSSQVTSANIFALANVNSDISGYKQLIPLGQFTQSTLATTAANVGTTETLIEEFAANAGSNVTLIPIGEIRLHYETIKASGGQSYYTYAKLFKRDSGGTETLLLTSDNSTATTDYTVKSVDLTFEVNAPISLLSSDRLVIKIYGIMSNASASISVRYDNNTHARIEIPVAISVISREFYVDSYGALGDGVTDDSAAFNSAVQSIGTYGSLLLTPGKTYLINNTVNLPIGIQLIGYNSKIKRSNATFTTLTAQGNSGATSISVANGSLFQVGQTFVVINSTLTYSGRGYLENSASNFGTAPQTITSIVGNTINFSNPLSQTCPNGSVVVRVFDLFRGAQSTTTVSGIGNSIFGIEFDGNRSNNNYTNSWVFNRTINDLPSKTIIKDCTFHDTPGENVFVSNQTTISDCNFYDCNGSAIHISQATSSNAGTTLFINNKGRNMCLATNAVTGHSEAFLTFSANPSRVIMQGNDLKTCSEGFCGMNTGSPYFIANDNIATDCKYVADIGNTAIGDVCEYFKMSDNQFINCGYLRVFNVGSITGDFVEKNSGNDKIQIVGNYFENVKIFIQRMSCFRFDDNELVTTANHIYSSTDLLSGLVSHLTITRSTYYSIVNNRFDNRKVVEDSRLTYAINCEYDFNLNLALSQPIKSAVGTSTEYCYYNRNVKVSGNTITNYSLGIADYFPASQIAPSRSLSWIGFEISNNTITCRDTKGYAIVCGPGTIVHDNKIYSNATNAALPGIVVLGVNDGNGSTYNNGGTQRLRLNGAIVYRNTIIGSNVSIIVGSTSASTGNNTYNAQVRDNYIDGTVTDNTSGNSTITGNVTLINETLFLQILRANSEFY